MAAVYDSEFFRGKAAATQGTGGRGGGSVDDTQKRLGIVETAIVEIRAILPNFVMKTEFEQFRGEVKAEFKEFRGEVKAEFEQVRGDIREIKAVLPHLATKAELQATRTEIEALRVELKDSVMGLRGEVIGLIHALEASIVKWLVGTTIASLTLALSVAKFVN